MILSSCIVLIYSALHLLRGKLPMTLCVPGNLKENSIEQKLIAMQNRMAAQEGEEASSGPDQMLEEACQLAVQLQQLSNHDCNAAKDLGRSWPGWSRLMADQPALVGVIQLTQNGLEDVSNQRTIHDFI